MHNNKSSSSSLVAFSLFLSMEAISSLDAPQWDGTCFRIVINTDKSAVWMNILSLSRLSDVYARKHSSRQKVERLVYYFRYVAMWSDSEILDHQVVCLDKDRKRERDKKNKMRSRVIDIIECVVFWFISLSQTHVYWSIASHVHSPFAQGSMGQLCIYLKWPDDGTSLFTYTQLSWVHKQIKNFDWCQPTKKQY